MRLLIDEAVPHSIAEYFARHGHEVLHVRDLLPGGVRDSMVATIGHQLAATWVTWDRPAPTEPGRKGSPRDVPREGQICFRCNHALGRALIELWLPSIEFHLGRSPNTRGLPRVEIYEDGITLLQVPERYATTSDAV